MSETVGLTAYIVVFVVTFFAGSLLIARCDGESPTDAEEATAPASCGGPAQMELFAS